MPIQLNFQFQQAKVEAIKARFDAKQRRYDATTKVWTIMPTLDNLEAVGPFCDHWQIQYNKDWVTAELRRMQTNVCGERPNFSTTLPLYIFQREGTQFLLRNPHAILADQMGLGKTYETMAAVQVIGKFPVLFVVPNSLKFNWERELTATLPGYKTIIPDKVWPVFVGAGGGAGADFIVLNYDKLHKFKDQLLATNWATIVFDEAHLIKNKDARRTEIAQALARTAPRVWCLTGTPVPNRPSDLVGLLTVTGAIDYFGGEYPFLIRYCDGKRGRFGFEAKGATNITELNQRLRRTCFLGRKKCEVLTELPAKRRTVIPVELDNLTEYRYAEDEFLDYVREKTLAQAKRDGLTDGAALRLATTKVVRASYAEYLVKIEALKQLSVAGKLAAFFEWLDHSFDHTEKLLVFTIHQSVQQELVRLYPQAAHLLADDSLKERQAAIDRFNDEPNCHLMIASCKIGGVGINLTKCHYVAFLEQNWTPADDEQCEDRCHRIGQTEPVQIYYFVGHDSIDETIWRMVDKKRQVADAITATGSIEEAVMAEFTARALARSKE